MVFTFHLSIRHKKLSDYRYQVLVAVFEESEDSGRTKVSRREVRVVLTVYILKREKPVKFE